MPYRVKYTFIVLYKKDLDVHLMNALDLMNKLSVIYDPRQQQGKIMKPLMTSGHNVYR